MTLRTTSLAEADVVDAAVWFERQRLGLGDDFLTDMDAAFAAIQQAPLACPTLHLEGVTFRLDLRWTRAGRFSFLVVFHIAGDEIVIDAVVHGHRDLEAILRTRVGAQ
jgi:plasmid stabilization system protein ParE